MEKFTTVLFSRIFKSLAFFIFYYVESMESYMNDYDSMDHIAYRIVCVLLCKNGKTLFRFVFISRTFVKVMLMSLSLKIIGIHYLNITLIYHIM